MKKHSIAMVIVLLAITCLPQLLVTGADAKGLPGANLDHTNGQMTVMLVIPAIVSGALVFMMADIRHNTPKID